MRARYRIRQSRNDFLAHALAAGWHETLDDLGEFALISPRGHVMHHIGEEWGSTLFARYFDDDDVSDYAESIGATPIKVARDSVPLPDSLVFDFTREFQKH